MTDVPELWFLTRAAGLVLLVLLTVTIALGVVATGRRTPSWWPRFATAALHANLAGLTVAMLVAHVATAVADGFVPITWTDAVVPFRSAYRPLWLGLGTLASSLLLVVLVTAAARRWLPPGLWRRAHFLVYAAWPPAVLHGLGTGSDTTSRPVLLLTFGCIGVVALATVVRFTVATENTWGRTTLRAAAILLPVAVGFWLGSADGPLRPGWAERSGTPAGQGPS
jgi:sulfoxide reductase heme-binding subunit YedZ